MNDPRIEIVFSTAMLGNLMERGLLEGPIYISMPKTTDILRALDEAPMSKSEAVNYTIALLKAICKKQNISYVDEEQERHIRILLESAYDNVVVAWIG